MTEQARTPNFWNMTNEARQRTKEQIALLTYFRVSGRVNIQTATTRGFSLEIVMHTWAVDTKEAIQKVLEETVHFYQRAYPAYEIKAQFLNDGPDVTVPGQFVFLL